MLRIMPVFGTRPEAIKMAPIVSALERSPGFEVQVVVTGQHRKMLDQVNELFGIKPSLDLDIFEPGQSLEQVTTRTLEGIARAISARRPDALVVQGDTTSAFAAGLAALYQRVPVFHVEAGLRTQDRWNPYPEEMNRRLISRLASLHLAPTATSRANLLAESVQPDEICVTGNTIIDALLDVTARPYHARGAIAKVLARDSRMVLVTTHRRESWGRPIQEIASALAALAAQEPDTLFLLPLHANPLVREPILSFVSGFPNVVVTDPLPYLEFAHLMVRSSVVLTDSGGVQEEAPSLGKPVLVMRDNTERPEAVAAGTVALVGTDRQRIIDSVSKLLHDPDTYAQMANAVNPYGDGQAARRTVAAMEHYFGLGDRLPDFDPAVRQSGEPRQ